MNNIRYRRPAYAAAVCMNILIIVIEVLVLLPYTLERGPSIFIMYTNISNALMALVCVVSLVALVRERRTGRQMPAAVTGIKVTALCMLVMTFLIVLLVLAPLVTDGYRYFLFSGRMFFTHFLCPLLAFVTVLFVERDRPLKFRWTFLAVIPTLAYGTVMMILNALRVVYGPYPFLCVYDQPPWQSVAWYIGILAATWVVSALLWLIKKVCSPRSI